MGKRGNQCVSVGIYLPRGQSTDRRASARLHSRPSSPLGQLDGSDNWDDDDDDDCSCSPKIASIWKFIKKLIFIFIFKARSCRKRM